MRRLIKRKRKYVTGGPGQPAYWDSPFGQSNPSLTNKKYNPEVYTQTGDPLQATDNTLLDGSTKNSSVQEGAGFKGSGLISMAVNAIGQVGAGFKKDNEQLNEDGTLKHAQRAKDVSYLGQLTDPLGIFSGVPAWKGDEYRRSLKNQDQAAINTITAREGMDAINENQHSGLNQAFAFGGVDNKPVEDYPYVPNTYRPETSRDNYVDILNRRMNPERYSPQSLSELDLGFGKVDYTPNVSPRSTTDYVPSTYPQGNSNLLKRQFAMGGANEMMEFNGGNGQQDSVELEGKFVDNGETETQKNNEKIIHSNAFVITPEMAAQYNVDKKYIGKTPADASKSMDSLNNRYVYGGTKSSLIDSKSLLKKSDMFAKGSDAADKRNKVGIYALEQLSTDIGEMMRQQEEGAQPQQQMQQEQIQQPMALYGGKLKYAGGGTDPMPMPEDYQNKEDYIQAMYEYTQKYGGGNPHDHNEPSYGYGKDDPSGEKSRAAGIDDINSVIDYFNIQPKKTQQPLPNVSQAGYMAKPYKFNIRPTLNTYIPKTTPTTKVVTNPNTGKKVVVQGAANNVTTIPSVNTAMASPNEDIVNQIDGNLDNTTDINGQSIVRDDMGNVNWMMNNLPIQEQDDYYKQLPNTTGNGILQNTPTQVDENGNIIGMDWLQGAGYLAQSAPMLRNAWLANQPLENETPEQFEARLIDLSEQRRQAQRAGIAARNTGLRNIKNIAGTRGQLLSNAISQDAGIREQVGDSMSQSFLTEETTNKGIQSSTDRANAAERIRARDVNEQRKAARTNIGTKAYENLGQFGSQVAQDAIANKTQDMIITDMLKTGMLEYYRDKNGRYQYRATGKGNPTAAEIAIMTSITEGGNTVATKEKKPAKLYGGKLLSKYNLNI